MKHYFLASLYAAVVVGTGMFIVYGGAEYGVGLIAGLIAALVAFFFALMLSVPFKFAREKLNGNWYFLLHLLVGFGIGAFRAAANPNVREFHQYIYNRDALLISCASLAAWAYIALNVPPGKKQKTVAEKARETWSPAITLATLVVLSIPIVTAPIPQDPSCHNVFRGDRTSASPSINMTVLIDASGTAELVGIYERFAEDYGLSIQGHPLVLESTQRSICNDDVLISAGGTFGGRHHLGFYEHIGAAEWAPMAGDLICRLEARWGDAVIFTGAGNEVVQKPKIVAIQCMNQQDTA